MAYKPSQRTSNFFAQSANLKTANAQDALARGQALRGAAQAGTDALQAEAKNVQGKAAAVQATDTSFNNTAGAKAGQLIKGATTSVVVTPAAPINAGNLVKTTAAKPVSKDQVVESWSEAVPNTGGRVNGGDAEGGFTYSAPNTVNKTKVVASYGRDAKGNAIPLDEWGNPIVQGEIDEAAAARIQKEQESLLDTNIFNAQTAMDAEQKAIQAEIDSQAKADLERKAALEAQNRGQVEIATTNNYGKLAQQSRQDEDNENFLRLLAEKNPSNIGLLSNLYKGGMKDAALDSNVLDSQLQTLKQGADKQIEGRVLADSQRQQSLKDYYSATASKQKEIVDKNQKQIDSLVALQKEKGTLSLAQTEALRIARNKKADIATAILKAKEEAKGITEGLNSKYKDKKAALDKLLVKSKPASPGARSGSSELDKTKAVGKGDNTKVKEFLGIGDKPSKEKSTKSSGKTERA